jgi:hypothetical protein
MQLVRHLLSPSGARAALKWYAAVFAVAAMAAGPATVGADQSSQKHHDRHDTIVFTIDVAEDFTRFAPTLVKPTDTQPERGSFFVTEGRIFPGGTIPAGGTPEAPGTFDPNSDGALGTWFCRGTHLVSATEFPTSARAVFTAQLYLLPDEGKSIGTEGVEGNAPVARIVTGGTGFFHNYVGEQRQQLLGFNASGGVNLRVTFILRKAAK